ncbi:MAG TPA: DNA polymerase IV [Candidatus Paceibacterota bacterium]|nr:DNA polymerase IV [Candidatus Paceibacterota bacterium]
MILHIDGDSFFAACEVSRNPWLRGKPVVTGAERGIVSAATYEAKKLGIHRAMPIFRVKREYPQVIVLPGDYELYGMYATRLYAIARRYASRVEEYGIDECFADLAGQDVVLGMSYEDIAHRIKQDLSTELALTFSLGLAETKALAKLGSKWGKPNGFTVIQKGEEAPFLAGTAVKDVWGVGRALSVYFEAQNIYTALDFVSRDPQWIREKYAKPTAELQRELAGERLWSVHDGAPEAPHSIQRTRTFTPPVRDRELLWSHFCRNVEDACAAARRDELIPGRASLFLKTQEFRYSGQEVLFRHPSDMPADVLRAVRPAFEKLFESANKYRATGITLYGFRRESELQLDMWNEREASRKRAKVFAAVDALEARYGRAVVELAASIPARDARRQVRSVRDAAYRERFRIPGTGAKHLPLPVLGTTS